MQIRKVTRALSIRSDAVNKTGPRYYVMIMKHCFEIYEPAQLDFSKTRTVRSAANQKVGQFSESQIVVCLLYQVRTYFQNQ